MELITTTPQLDSACDALRQCDFIAIDTEFIRESTFWPQLCLIQAAGGETEVLIDPLADGLDLEPFWDLMADERVMKVFHAPRQDLEIFFHLADGLIPEPIFDSQVAAMALGLGDSIAYDKLVQAVLKRPIDKGPRFTDWSRRPLTKAQSGYALADVTHLRDLYPTIRDRLEKADRLSWVAEEMAILTDPATYEQHPENAWQRLKIRKNSAKWLAVLRAAAAWREEEAQTRDIPRQRIVKDEGLYEIAHAAPAKADDLAGMRALPRGFERSRPAERLIEKLKPALADPKAYAPDVPPPPRRPEGASATVELLKVLLKLVAEEKSVAARLIATVPDLEAIATSDDADVPALRGWRREVFGETALDLKRGKIALVLENGRVTAKPH
ncbi:ribonuclease D [Hyphobacterium sp.]|jgi:ribonuclease D|uniref:ribonuclease D n=1 Tax=Hyphobacterium sp. TaxID=2004662 RepID=UPI003BABC976